MKNHTVQKATSGEPENILKPLKPGIIAGNPPWRQSRGGNYGAVCHYDLLSKEQIKSAGKLMGGQTK